MSMYVLAAVAVLGAMLFFAPGSIKRQMAFSLHLLLALLTSWPAIQVLFGNAGLADLGSFPLLGHEVHFLVDKLSAFFVLVVNFTSLTGSLYALGYLKPYLFSKSKAEISLHLFSFLWLHFSMLLVCLIRDGLGFLIAWELMSLSSFLLVIFDSGKPGTIKIGLNYLIQMHIGLAFIMGGLIFAYAKTGAEFSFDGLADYFGQYAPLPLFLVFFVGFGIKAGFMPLHTWLPHAHPAAPSHVSGVMSGVMIKMGIYGMLRVLTYIHTDLLSIGIFILVMSLISGLLGVMYAIVQHDLKKLLAYHSIENIGIIGIGIGVGLIGVAHDNAVLAALGFTGGLLHILNHSLFKSLLFYAAGSVYQQTHTREIEQLGGLIRKMPRTAFFFLLGALAICGLPPFNGFVSEFLIYSGLFEGLRTSGLSSDIAILATFIGLVLIGGLAIFCFTKVFSIVFLGTPRSDKVEQAQEVQAEMQTSYFLPGLLIVAIGLLPALFVGPVSQVAGMFVPDLTPVVNSIPVLYKVSLAGGIFILLIGVLWFFRQAQQKKVQVVVGPTWGCGYTGGDPALHQYTATSFADNYQTLARPVLNVHRHYEDFEEAEIFPQPRKFETHTTDLFEDKLITAPSRRFLSWVDKVGVFQTGQLQHYVLYGLVFLALIFLLTLFKLI